MLNDTDTRAPQVTRTGRVPADWTGAEHTKLVASADDMTVQGVPPTVTVQVDARLFPMKTRLVPEVTLLRPEPGVMDVTKGPPIYNNQG